MDAAGGDAAVRDLDIVCVRAGGVTVVSLLVAPLKRESDVVGAYIYSGQKWDDTVGCSNASLEPRMEDGQFCGHCLRPLGYYQDMPSVKDQGTP